MVKNNKAFKKPNKTTAVNVARNTTIHSTGTNADAPRVTYTFPELTEFQLSLKEVEILKQIANQWEPPETAEPFTDMEVDGNDPNLVPWSGPIAFEGVTTPDGRELALGSFSESHWPLPFPLSYMNTTRHGDTGQAIVVGTLNKTMLVGNEIWGSGFIDLATGEVAAQAVRNIDTGAITGLSIEPHADDEDVETETVTRTDDGMEYEEVVKVILKKWMLTALTIVPVPAFPGAYIQLDNKPAVMASLTAAGMFQPPADFFLNPMLTEPTRVTITEQGHIFGHIATWDTCHAGISNKCVKPPRPQSDDQASYRQFHRDNPITCQDGSTVMAGMLTLGTGHADKLADLKTAEGHYDDTGWAAADVAIGADDIGIWIAGAVRPGLSEAQLFEAARANWSGDWRSDSGSLELVAVLGVNVPGFPVYAKREVKGRILAESLVASAQFCDDTVVEDIPQPTNDTDPLIVLSARIESMAGCIARLSAYVDRKEIEELDGIMHMQA